MEALLAELTALLRDEIEQYRRLLLLVRRERSRITKGELPGLTQLVRKKELIAHDLASLEASRSSLLERLAEALGEEPADLTLARVARLVPGDLGEGLQALLVEFRGVVGHLIAANDINRDLLDQSLAFVRESLALFRTVANASPTYGKNGRVGESGSALMALNHTA
jgi:flagellar biosynthesis/type III secretory pathway chaperone